MAQNQVTPKGPSLISNTALETVPSHAGMAEQCLAVEALAEEVGALAQPGAVQEITTSEILSQDVLLEEASLEVGESHQPYQTSLVIEETLVNSSPDLPTGNLAGPHPQVGESMSVVTVMRVSGFCTDIFCFFLDLLRRQLAPCSVLLGQWYLRVLLMWPFQQDPVFLNLFALGLAP